MHKNKFATLSGMCHAIVFSHFEPKTWHNAKFWAPTSLFSEVADPTNTRRKFLTELRKLLKWFLLNPLHRDFQTMLIYVPFPSLNCFSLLFMFLDELFTLR